MESSIILYVRCRPIFCSERSLVHFFKFCMMAVIKTFSLFGLHGNAHSADRGVLYYVQNLIQWWTDGQILVFFPGTRGAVRAVGHRFFGEWIYVKPDPHRLFWRMDNRYSFLLVDITLPGCGLIIKRDTTGTTVENIIYFPELYAPALRMFLC